MMNENTLSQNINITQQPAAPSNEPSTNYVPLTVPLTVTFPPVTALAPAKTQEMNVAKVLGIVGSVLFIVGSLFFLLIYIV